MDSYGMKRISRSLSYLLRHSPEFIDLDGGWAQVSAILDKLRQTYPSVDRALLEQIVAEDKKGRYTFDSTRERIRANQGHSVPGARVEMETPVPPEFLYHGTAQKFLDSILWEGLKPMGRLFVHISPDVPTAIAVGRRHGKAVVLEVAAGRMVQDGLPLRCSTNGVWQAESVPPNYLRVMEQAEIQLAQKS